MKKIHELESQGLKKVVVKSKLGISDTALNKYWYEKQDITGNT